MKDKFTKLLGFVGIVAVLAMIFAACFTVFKAAFTDIAGLGDFISAFTGAFFAFTFVKLGELGTRLYVRQRTNQVALVTFEQIFQEYVNRLFSNDFVADDIIHTIEATISEPDGPIKINFNYLKPVPINTSPMIDLRNIDYKNDVLNFCEDLEKLNNSMSAVQRFYDLITMNMMSGQLSREAYLNNLPVIKEKLVELKGFLGASTEDCVDVATKARLLLKEKSFWLTSAIQLGPQNYPDGFEAKVTAEKKKVQKEMEENSKASLERIKKILNRSSDT